MFTPRMVQGDCNQPEPLPPLTFFPIFLNITTTDCWAVMQLVELKGGTLVEWGRSPTQGASNLGKRGRSVRTHASGVCPFDRYFTCHWWEYYVDFHVHCEKTDVWHIVSTVGTSWDVTYSIVKATVIKKWRLFSKTWLLSFLLYFS